MKKLMMAFISVAAITLSGCAVYPNNQTYYPPGSGAVVYENGYYVSTSPQYQYHRYSQPTPSYREPVGRYQNEYRHYGYQQQPQYQYQQPSSYYGNAPRNNGGAMVGTVAGGLLGAQVGRGSGRVAAAAAGAAIGGVVGSGCRTVNGGQVIGAIAGGLLGSKVGKGSGQIAAAAVGSSIGAQVGNDMAGGCLTY